MPQILDYKDAAKHGHLVQKLNQIDCRLFNKEEVVQSLLAIAEFIQIPQAIIGSGKLCEHLHKLVGLYHDASEVRAIVFRIYDFTQTEDPQIMNRRTRNTFLELKRKIEKICQQYYQQDVEAWFQKRFTESFKNELNTLPDAKEINPHKVNRILLVGKSQISDPEIVATIRNIFIAKSYRKNESPKLPENIEICYTAAEVIAKAKLFQVVKLDILGHVPRFRQVYSSYSGPVNILQPFKMGDIIGTKESIGEQIGALVNAVPSLKTVRLFSCFSAGEDERAIDTARKVSSMSSADADSLVAHVVLTLNSRRRGEVKLSATPYALSAVPGVLTKPFFVASKSGDFLWRNGRFIGNEDSQQLHSNLWIHYQNPVVTPVASPSASA